MKLQITLLRTLAFSFSLLIFAPITNAALRYYDEVADDGVGDKLSATIIWNDITHTPSAILPITVIDANGITSVPNLLQTTFNYGEFTEYSALSYHLNKPGSLNVYFLLTNTQEPAIPNTSGNFSFLSFVDSTTVNPISIDFKVNQITLTPEVATVPLSPSGILFVSGLLGLGFIGKKSSKT
jgi:hypothetical protein